MVPVKAIILKHQNAPVSIRELLHYDAAQIDILLLKIQELLGLNEFFILSTCNRTELYYISENHLDKELIAILCHQKGIFEVSNYESYFTCYHNPYEVLTHLFSVAIGLESVVLGDLQVIHQVKQAYIQSNQHKLVGPFFHRMFHAIFHANKRVQNETNLKNGSASVAYAGAEICYELTQNLPQPKILVIGLGEIGGNLTENLLDNFSVSQVYISNRTIDKSLYWAQKYPVQVIPFEELVHRVQEFDIIVSAISMNEPLIIPSWLENSSRTHYFIDLGVPRTIHPDVEKLGNIIFNIDDIQYRVNEALELRKKSIPFAKQIIEEEINALFEWSKELSISPVIQQIKDALDQIRKEELTKYMNKVDEQSMKFMEEITQSMIQKNH
ncbi:MAG: glutamyl-tRNA reductase [Bacteroidia bacterium]|nr:MAG: glutamyl-tRNA reductase [Bacteroidia bacterium]